MDLGLSRDPIESYKLFQRRVSDQYDQMVSEFGLTVINADRAPMQVPLAHDLHDAAVHRVDRRVGRRPLIEAWKLPSGTTFQFTSSGRRDSA